MGVPENVKPIHLDMGQNHKAVDPSWFVRSVCLYIHAFNHRMLASNIRYVPVYIYYYTYIYIYIYGGFLKWGYPQIIHFNRMFSYKLRIIHFGYPDL